MEAVVFYWRRSAAESTHLHFGVHVCLSKQPTMHRQYAPLLPKNSFTEDMDDVGCESEMHSSKKRRIGVSVACESCRLRKIRVSKPIPLNSSNNPEVTFA